MYVTGSVWAVAGHELLHVPDQRGTGEGVGGQVSPSHDAGTPATHHAHYHQGMNVCGGFQLLW